MKRFLKTILVFTAPIMIALVIFLAIHNVPTSITEEDKLYIRKILQEAGHDVSALSETFNFEEELRVIQAVQYSAFHTAPGKKVLPVNNPREPRNLHAASSAYCGDRSRYMFKALSSLGFDVRFASVYEDSPEKSFIETMLTPGMEGAQSHAIVEVLTSKGWMVVDSRTKWVSLRKDGVVASLDDLQIMAENKSFPEWSERNQEGIYFLMKDPFHIIYGLYSRHGRFYAPYTPYVPDINWGEFLLNFSR